MTYNMVGGTLNLALSIFTHAKIVFIIMLATAVIIQVRRMIIISAWCTACHLSTRHGCRHWYRF